MKFKRHSSPEQVISRLRYTRILWWRPCASSQCQSSCATAICWSRWHGRPAFVHSSFRSAQLPLICIICVERPSVWTEEQRH